MTVIHEDWKESRGRAPFDLRVLDGGGPRQGLDWLEHHALLATELRLTTDSATIVGTIK